VVLYGHTHLPAVDSAEGMLLVNPGPLKEGLTPSYAVLTVDGGEVQAELFGFTPNAT
jgi:uncharacterized protein